MAPLTKAQKKQAQAAEDSFNRTYAAQYGEERWQQTLYPALVAPTRYAMLINRYATTSDIPEAFTQDEAQGLQPITFPSPPLSSNPEKPEPPTTTTPAEAVSSSLLAYQSDSPTPFPPPHPHPSTRLLTHWNLDAASLLAATLLAPRPGNKVLDLCAAPGGKSLALSQLLRPTTPSSPPLGGGCLHSNEPHPARNQRLSSNLASYLPASLFSPGAIKVLRLDASAPTAATQLPLGPGAYDKVLLDAPCSSERHVVHARATGSWRSGSSRQAAKTQLALLATALRALRVGGQVLYATCSLSGDENDGVVARGLEWVAKERRKTRLAGKAWGVAVRSADLAPLLQAWAEPTAHGWLVLPDHPAGGRWGPLYFALLEKVAV
ncbi:S-adenosyl-L-methionine-dependent methyltransferase [Camillea tinctor]|nr:S-adenosyl-L-methionine-dependent methyltransferase [Camillea tinctor]